MVHYAQILTSVYALHLLRRTFFSAIEIVVSPILVDIRIGRDPLIVQFFYKFIKSFSPKCLKYLCISKILNNSRAHKIVHSYKKTTIP